ncbi:hypothetical protein LEP1GSC151_1455 [Leptospira interrogans serovar Grippotyphosa str. LT2186]|uniref:Uncharacterized protein n=1 Tax=Leptospira interrogans serovar Grippotyphosa str. LT2186 TaxID=1001599 RepID=M3FRH0_LEPIR|nr:hypothetical protein LEP1GSC151_1455 [Leptospira interrogans serovar Grippotyphosa str. LT2186]
MKTFYNRYLNNVSPRKKIGANPAAYGSRTGLSALVKLL